MFVWLVCICLCICVSIDLGAVLMGRRVAHWQVELWLAPSRPTNHASHYPHTRWPLQSMRVCIHVGISNHACECVCDLLVPDASWKTISVTQFTRSFVFQHVACCVCICLERGHHSVLLHCCTSKPKRKYKQFYHATRIKPPLLRLSLSWRLVFVYWKIK